MHLVNFSSMSPSSIGHITPSLADLSGPNYTTNQSVVALGEKACRLYRTEGNEFILIPKTPAEIIDDLITSPFLQGVSSLWNSRIVQISKNYATSSISYLYSRILHIDNALTFPSVAAAKDLSKLKKAVERVREIRQSLIDEAYNHKSDDSEEVKNIRDLLSLMSASEYNSADLLGAGWDETLIKKVKDIEQYRDQNQNHLDNLNRLRERQGIIKVKQKEIERLKTEIATADTNAKAKLATRDGIYAEMTQAAKLHDSQVAPRDAANDERNTGIDRETELKEDYANCYACPQVVMNRMVDAVQEIQRRRVDLDNTRANCNRIIKETERIIARLEPEVKAAHDAYLRFSEQRDNLQNQLNSIDEEIKSLKTEL